MFRRIQWKVSEDLGRYLTSNENFNPGDIVFQESSLVSAPTFGQNYVSNDEDLIYSCVGCDVRLFGGAAMTCRECHWPCCSIDCSMSTKHNKYECKFLARHHTSVNRTNFDMLLHLRVLLLKQLDPIKYEKFLDLCCEFSEEDEVCQKKDEQDIQMVWTFLTEECEMIVSKKEVSRLWTIIRINGFLCRAFEDVDEYVGMAAFYCASFFSHGCAPNLEYCFLRHVDENGYNSWTIRLSARKTIQSGDILSISYSPDDLELGTALRQMRIHKSRRFTCKCIRCSDKTEGGTMFQGMICPSCGKGIMLPMKPIEIVESPWLCDSCDYMEDSHSVARTVEMLQTVPMSLARMRHHEDSSKMADNFLDTQKQLHLNHYIMYQCAMHWLLGSRFTAKLMSPGEDAKKLFTKILTRTKRYLPLCENFMPAAVLAHFLKVVSTTYAAYVFKSADMTTIFHGDHPISFMLRICRRMVELFNRILFWKRLKLLDIEMDLIIVEHWSERVLGFINEIEEQEKLALESVPHLFF